MLAVGVDGKDYILGAQAAGLGPGPYFFESAIVGGRHAPVLLEAEYVNVGPACRPLFDEGAGPICRPVVHDDELVGEGLEAGEDGDDCPFFVVSGRDGDATDRAGLMAARMVGKDIYAHRRPWLPATSLSSRAVNQSIVRLTPSAKLTCGSQPSSDRAFSLDTAAPS